MKRNSFLIAFAALMLFSFGLADGATEIVLNNGVPSEGYYGGDTVKAGVPVKFDFRLIYTPGDGSTIFGSTNGFNVWTAKSLADPTTPGYFSPITYDTFAVNWKSMYNSIFFGPTPVDGAQDGLGADTLGIGGFSILEPGIPDGFDTLVWWIRTTPSTNGDTLCVDSSYYRPGGEWLWSTSGALGDIGADWGGPYCFHVYDSSIVAANLVVDPHVLNFNAVAGGANPSDQTLDINSDGDPLDFNLAKDSAWLSMSPTSGTTGAVITVSIDITGLPVGSYRDTIDVTSATASNSPQYVEVNLVIEAPPNNPPIIDPIVSKSVDEGVNLNFLVTATDPDGTTPSFAMDNKPAGASFTDNGDGTATFDWTPGFDESGVYPVTFIASDGSLADSELVEITVNDVNRPPAIDPIADTTIDECQTLSFVISATDPDGDALVLTVSTVYPNMTFDDNGDGTADFGFDPDYTQAGAYPLTVYAYDDFIYDSIKFTITVTECYLLVVTPDTLHFTAVEGGANPDAQNFYVDEAGGADIAYVALENTDWFGLNKTSGTTLDSVLVSVDITGLTADQYYGSVDFSVEKANISQISTVVHLNLISPENNPPELDSIGPKVVDEGQNLNFNVTASDPDEDPIELSIDPTYPGMSFTDHGDGTGTFDWTPDFDQADAYFVTFFAFDGSLVDSERVQITVNNVNRPPVIAPIADTTIDECDTLVLTFTATDPDNDPLDLEMNTLYDNMQFIDSGNGTGVFVFTPNFDQAGVYPLELLVTDGQSQEPVSELFTITVTDCEAPPPCVDMILSDSVFHFVDTLENDKGVVLLTDTLTITSTGNEFCFFLFCDTDSYWISHSTDSGCTPANVEIQVNPYGLGAGQHVGYCWVVGDSTVCEPSTQIFVVVLDIIDTTFQCEDTLKVATVPAVPGAQVVVPVEFGNCCDLSGIAVVLEWACSDLYLDSISYSDSRLGDFPIKYDTIDNGAMKVVIGAANDGSVSDVTPGYGNFVNMHFSVAVEASADSCRIDLYSGYRSNPDCYNPIFAENCGEGPEVIVPTFIPGGIVIDTSANFVCGYVVDTAGNPIPGATVELWADFPFGSPELSTIANGSGAFAFYGFTTVPFDLWGYHEGYYPGLVQNLNFGETGVMIVLTPIGPVTPTNEWVNFYCDENSFMGAPMPVGSVVDAYDPDGVHCGTFYVTESGSYGFMPVYGEEPYNEGDQGAEPGDVITFFINGLQATTFGDDPIWTQNGDSWEVCLEAGLVITKYCDLMEGWNLVSWNVDHESDYILDALQSIEPCIDLVMGFEQGGLTYDPDLPQFSTLWYVDHLSGYWIKTNCATTLEITGAVVPPTTPIPVTAGWNLVSYLPDFSLPPQDALVSLDDNLIVALGWDGGPQTYEPGYGEENGEWEMGPCFGYWLKIWEDDELIYPGNGPVIAASQKGPHPVSLAPAAFDLTPTNRWLNLYGSNLTLDGKTVPAGATITAHAFDGTKIGSFTLTQEGLFGFMPVYADDPTTTELEGIKSGEQFSLAVDGKAVNEGFVWTQTGDKIEVERLTAKAGSDQVLPEGYSLNQNYPNPFNPTTTISFTLPVTGKAKIEIFNILGNLIATPFDGAAQAGANEVVWDGRDFSGETVSSGIYFYRLSADKYTETKKMTMLK